MDSNNEIGRWIDLYRNMGYKVLGTSIFSDEGFSDLKNLCMNKKNIFWGQSGVGKSSLLNKLFPKLQLGTGQVSRSTDKGLHTTVTSVLLKVEENTYVIDTPGIREIDPYGIRKEDLCHYFIEFGKFAEDCKFNTCTHHHEPGCIVINAVENQEISFERYDSYLRILDTIEEDIIF